jgi:hypothetical protein
MLAVRKRSTLFEVFLRACKYHINQSSNRYKLASSDFNHLQHRDQRLPLARVEIVAAGYWPPPFNP